MFLNFKIKKEMEANLRQKVFRFLIKKKGDCTYRKKSQIQNTKIRLLLSKIVKELYKGNVTNLVSPCSYN